MREVLEYFQDLVSSVVCCGLLAGVIPRGKRIEESTRCDRSTLSSLLVPETAWKHVSFGSFGIDRGHSSSFAQRGKGEKLRRLFSTLLQFPR